MKLIHPLHGLVAAAHSPFHEDGSLNLAVVEKQAAHFLNSNVATIFICGTTGECHSLSLEERRALAKRWFEVARGMALKIVVHVGSNCLADARALAAQAQSLGAVAISALAPSYFKPRSLDALARAPERIPTLAGLKFTNPDLMAYQFCLRADDGRWDVPFGVDEHFLGALAIGARGAVGSGFNFAAPVYHRLLKAFSAGDFAAAREEQFRGARLVRVLSGFGYMAAAKAVMGMLGVPVGPPRLPEPNLTAGRREDLRRKLDEMGFSQWVR